MEGGGTLTFEELPNVKMSSRTKIEQITHYRVYPQVSLLTRWLSFRRVGLGPLPLTHRVTPTNFIPCHGNPKVPLLSRPNAPLVSDFYFTKYCFTSFSGWIVPEIVLPVNRWSFWTRYNKVYVWNCYEGWHSFEQWLHPSAAGYVLCALLTASAQFGNDPRYSLSSISGICKHPASWTSCSPLFPAFLFT